MSRAHCPRQAHNRFSANYDGRLDIVKELNGGRVERCTKCGDEYFVKYFSEAEDYDRSIQDGNVEHNLMLKRIGDHFV